MGLEKILSKQVKKLKKDKNIVSIVQSGSSLREDFVQGLSDIDLLIIKKYAKSGLKIGYDGDIELNFIYRNKGDYICTTSPGNITFLLSLKNKKLKSVFYSLDDKEWR